MNRTDCGRGVNLGFSWFRSHRRLRVGHGNCSCPALRPVETKVLMERHRPRVPAADGACRAIRQNVLNGQLNRDRLSPSARARFVAAFRTRRTVGSDDQSVGCSRRGCFLGRPGPLSRCVATDWQPLLTGGSLASVLPAAPVDWPVWGSPQLQFLTVGLGDAGADPPRCRLVRVGSLCDRSRVADTFQRALRDLVEGGGGWIDLRPMRAVTPPPSSTAGLEAVGRRKCRAILLHPYPGRLYLLPISSCTTSSLPHTGSGATSFQCLCV